MRGLRRSRATLWAVIAAVWAIVSCAAPAQGDAQQSRPAAPAAGESAAPQTPQAPREVRAGLAEMAMQVVEQHVAQDEVFQTLATMVAEAPACVPWPAVWIEGSDRRSFFLVRYDLMARDWGSDVAAEARGRMEEFVAMGMLTRRERPEVGADAVEYVLTDLGRVSLQGSPYTSQRPRFCGASERRLVAITSMEWGRYPCGTLRVRFSHVADGWPSWVSGTNARARLAWPPLGSETEGQVSLSRQWYSSRALPRGAVNGALRSVCFEDGRVAGGDLDLFPP